MKLLKKIQWTWDFYFARFLYNERKLHHYHSYMTKEWGLKYTQTQDPTDEPPTYPLG